MWRTCVRRMGDLKAAHDQGRKLLQSQSHTVRCVVENGKHLAAQVDGTDCWQCL